jgi:TatD DNase family protein
VLVDSHAHLDDPRFDEDRDAVVERAWDAGVRTILTIGNGSGPDDMGCGLPLAAHHDWIYTTAGIHPHDAAKAEERHFPLMEDMLGRPGVVAVGETGLDYYYDNSPRAVQRDVFRAQLVLANRLNMPVIIHTRDADADTIQILAEERPLRGVVHCFTGGEALADCALEQGLMISFSGIVTFKGSETLKKIAARVPEDRFLVETDCPYLAPGPHRGKRNEPAFVAETARTLAGLRGSSVEKLVAQTGHNFHQLFEIA